MGRAPARRERRGGASDGHYKGVRMRKWGKWVAEVRQPNSRERIWLGSYDTAEEAARAYDAAVFCLRGPSALINFPTDPPRISFSGDLSPSQIQVAASRHARRVPVELSSEQLPTCTNSLAESTDVESKFFRESSDTLIGSSYRDCYLAVGDRDGGVNRDGAAGGGEFYEGSHVWRF